jgi:hypothetical protein
MLTLLINETKPLAGLFASTTGGIGSVPDISVADEGQAVSVQTFTRTAGVITDSFVAGDVLHIGIGDGVNAPVCYIELSSASPATGTMPINTAGMVALFAATVANQLKLTVGVVRTRGGSTNTIFSAPIVIHRSVINIATAVPTPSILGTGVAAALQVAINTAMGFVRLDASARLPAVDGSQLTNLPGGGGGSGTVTSVAQSFTGGLISVAGSPITASGTLALTVAGTSGGIPYFSSGTTWATSAALAANALVVGGGAGAAPATVTTGANVLTALGIAVGSAGAFITFDGDAGTPSVLVGTNISGTAANLTAGLVSSIGSLTGDVTSSNRATTLATVNSNVGSFTNASLTVNAKGLVTAASSGTAAVTSITGTANEITVTGTTTPTLSLPSALTFTDKTVTGGTFVLPQVGYLAATFDYFGEWMTFISSTDAATWKRTHATPIVTTEGTIRDPALHYVAATGTFYVAYTRNAFTGGNSWGLGSSTDGRTWTWSTISTGSLATGTPAHVWIGDWFTDSDGTDHVLFAANTTASQAAGGLYLYETHPTTPGDYSAWSTPVQITGSAITNNLGNSPAVVKVGSTYHLFYDLPSAGGIRHVTSTSLTSGFNTAGTYPSFPSATEGPAMFALANGTYRLYAEQNYQQSTAGLKYSDSTDLVTWGSVQSAVTQGYMGHPHGIQVTSQELLNKVSMLEQGQKNPVWSSLYDGKTAVAIGYPDINTESAFGPYGEGLTIFGGASGGSFLYVSTRNQNGAAIFTDPNASSPAGNNFYIARRSGLNYMKFDGGANNVSFYGTATFLGSTSGSATISVSATGGLLALPSGTTATNMALTTPDLGTPSAIVLTNASGTASININGTVGATTPAAGSFTTLTVNDNTTLGSNNSDTVNFNARVASDINPATDNTYDLGVTGHEWRNLNIDGTANIDSLVADTADINGGTIDATAIGGTTPSTGAFTTLTASSTSSLLLGTAGSAVGNIGFRNADSGTTTLAPATGALGTGTVTLPLSGTLATLAGTETLTNKRITQRSGTAASSATPTINTDNVDFYSLTAQAADITSFTTNLSGTPTEGQTLWIAITGTAARAITWGATFEAGAVALPTTTVSTDRLDVAFVWNTVTSKWRCMASG